VKLQPSAQDGRLTYQATLAPGTLQGGTYQVTGQGGSQVGAFTANADIPAPIMAISTAAVGGAATNLQPGTLLPAPCASTGFFSPCIPAYNFSWTGGDNRSLVTLEFIIGKSFRVVASAYGGTEGIFIPSAMSPSPLSVVCTVADSTYPLLSEGNVEVIVTQTPSQAPSQPFSAPGLGWGG
jgi:hypothetical protein